MRENVYIEVSGLPPQKLPDYYSNYNFERLAKKMIFGTDWPGVPGPMHNAEIIASLGLDDETRRLIFSENAKKVYRFDGADR